uniref:Uncharacterized protein n=1 Tax=Micrurus surinamensis TaxID=129470 RepID=A0A2D4PZX9_MICSU
MYKSTHNPKLEVTQDSVPPPTQNRSLEKSAKCSREDLAGASYKLHTSYLSIQGYRLMSCLFARMDDLTLRNSPPHRCTGTIPRWFTRPKSKLSSRSWRYLLDLLIRSPSLSKCRHKEPNVSEVQKKSVQLLGAQFPLQGS